MENILPFHWVRNNNIITVCCDRMFNFWNLKMNFWNNESNEIITSLHNWRTMDGYVAGMVSAERSSLRIDVFVSGPV